MPAANDNPAHPDVMEAGRDVLQNPDAPLPINEAKAVRAQERLQPDGKAIATAERGEMYHDLEGVGESGTQAGVEGEENADHNPIGRRI